MNNKQALEKLINGIPRESKKHQFTIEEIAEHLDKNNVIVLPCAIGSTVWAISKNSTEPFPAKFRLDDLAQMGKRVFLTRAEAMKHLGREKRR